MHDTPQDPVERLLDECLAVPSDRWQAAIDDACNAHAELADELRRRFAMLAHAGLVGGGAGPSASSHVPANGTTLPRAFGGFDLLTELGRGGMGVVWLARQRSTGREVALKTIRSDLLAVDKARQRFRREVEAVSKLHHPGICTVYEAGEVDGIPFVAMRHVQGSSLLAHIGTAAPSIGNATTVPAARTNGDGVRNAVRWFEKAARALHHAHAAGILHRDIKPGNLMIDSDGDPVVLDFGLARPEHEDSAALTASGDELGTPAYMSPEQISPAGRRLDRRTDIYSLAVTMYELLAGRHPFAATTREELYRRILAGAAPSLARIHRHVPKDLAVVVATAMETERDRRYETAVAFADDLERVLAHQPIHARRPSPWARLLRWVRREPLVAALLLALLVGLAAMTFFAIRAEQLRANAIVLQDAAHTEATTARRVTEFLVELFEVADRSAHRGRTITAREVLDLGSRRIARELDSEPLVQARLRTTMGLVYQHLGVFDVARDQFEHALALRQQHSASGDALADSLFHLGELRHFQDDYTGAESYYQQALVALRSVHAGDHLDIARNLDLVGRARRDLGQLDEAASMHDEALQMRRRLTGNDSLAMADSLQSLAMLDNWRGDFDRARSNFQRAIELRQRGLGNDHGDLPELMFGLAMIDYQSGRTADAKTMVEATLAMCRKVFGDVHHGVGHCLNLLGTMAADTNDLATATRHYEAALVVLRQVEGEQSREVATLIHNLGSLARQRGDRIEAMRLFEEAMVVRRALFQPDDPSFADGLFAIGLTHADGKDHDAALTALGEALRIRTKVLGVEHADSRAVQKAIDRVRAAGR